MMTKNFALAARSESFLIGNEKVLHAEKWKEQSKLDSSKHTCNPVNTKQERSPQGYKERFSIHLLFAEPAAIRNLNVNASLLNGS